MITRFFAPQLVNNFSVNALETFSEKGIINPCTFALVQEIVDFLPKGLGAVYHRLIFIFIYFAVLATVILLSLKAILKINSQKIEDKGKWLVFFICLVYALVAPRFKDYSYIILIPPTYFIMQKMRGIKAGTLFFVLVILSAKGVTLPGFDYICYFLWNYYPLFLAFMVWGVYLYELRD
ncbi:MAG: hypothetical protein NT033_04835 [Candidatus Omnitrophica bacterium]|nr:hypothetical protein [Candidatus Omnitrophota bacterium]